MLFSSLIFSICGTRTTNTEQASDASLHIRLEVRSLDVSIAMLSIAKIHFDRETDKRAMRECVSTNMSLLNRLFYISVFATDRERKRKIVAKASRHFSLHVYEHIHSTLNICMHSPN